MRRLFIMMVLGILLQACSIDSILNPPTSTPVEPPTRTLTVTPIDTLMPTNTPTLRPTSTIVRIATQDPNQPTETFIPIPIFVGENTITPISTSTVYSPGDGFLTVSVSEKKIFWGSCKLNKTKITARVEDPKNIVSVVIFVRLKSAKKEDYTPWSTGDVMFYRGDGVFSYTLVGSEIEGHNDYKDSWVYFQLVATDDKGYDIGRTTIFTNSISLSPCM